MFQNVDVMNFDVDVLKHAIFPWIITYFVMWKKCLLGCTNIELAMKHNNNTSYFKGRNVAKFFSREIVDNLKNAKIFYCGKSFIQANLRPLPDIRC